MMDHFSWRKKNRCKKVRGGGGGSQVQIHPKVKEKIITQFKLECLSYICVYEKFFDNDK